MTWFVDTNLSIRYLTHDDPRNAMKHLAKVSSKGQITLPKELRDCLGIKPNGRVELVLEDDRAFIRAERDPIARLRRRLPQLDVDIDEAIRAAKQEKAAREASGNS